MSFRVEETEVGKEIVFEGFEKGIAVSPHKGVANIKNANISTETGEVMCSYGRTKQSQTSFPVAAKISTTLSPNFTITASAGGTLGVDVLVGMWVTVANSTDTGVLPNGNYYVLSSSGLNSNVVTLSTRYNGSTFTYAGSCTADISLTREMSTPVDYAVETYGGSGQTTYYRYYVLDSQGLVWVYDTQTASPSTFVRWFLPDISITYFSADTAPSGIAVLNGWLIVASGNKLWGKQTVNLAGTTSTATLWQQLTNINLQDIPNSQSPHRCFVGRQGKMYVASGQYLGSLFPTSTIATAGLANSNVQSYCRYSASTTTGTLLTLISGTIPWQKSTSGTVYRVPAVFFTLQSGTQPTNLTANTVYYIEWNADAGTFQVFAAPTGGSAINIQTGAAGNQYFNTFWPISNGGLFGTTPTMTWEPQAMKIEEPDIIKCMTEIGNTLVLGGAGNVLYPWNQIDPTPSDLIPLPEANTTQLINVNKMAYAFTGNKGNIYITNGSVASHCLKVPDYCAGIEGTPGSYIEPRFTWGGVAFIRGRVYFSILDQTSTKAGNCGGIWSFVPAENFFVGEDTGLALRLENQNSYATYNGVATVIIPAVDQNAISPQYWAAWYSSVSSATYGIDFTASTVTGAAVIETDFVPTGTFLDKLTSMQLEYKLSEPLADGETVTAKWRTNLTSAFADFPNSGAANTESDENLAGYFVANFGNSQWVQFQVTINALTNSSSTFGRLAQLRLR